MWIAAFSAVHFLFIVKRKRRMNRYIFVSIAGTIIVLWLVGAMTVAHAYDVILNNTNPLQDYCTDQVALTGSNNKIANPNQSAASTYGGFDGYNIRYLDPLSNPPNTRVTCDSDTCSDDADFGPAPVPGPTLQNNPPGNNPDVGFGADGNPADYVVGQISCGNTVNYYSGGETIQIYVYHNCGGCPTGDTQECVEDSVCGSPGTGSISQCVCVGSSAPPASGSLNANPNPCAGFSGGSCDSTITWTTNNVSAAEVFVNGSLFATGISGSQDDPAIPVSGSATFDLYNYSSGSQGALLSTISVSGNPAPVNGVCAAPPNGSNYASAPPGPYCGAGTFSGLSGSGPWTWTCNGQNGGTSQSCNAGTTAIGSCTMAPTTDFFAGTQGDGQTYLQQVFITNTSPNAVMATPQVTGAPSWFSISPASAPIASGRTATFTVTATTGSLASGTYYYGFNTALAGGTTPSCNTSVGSAVTFYVASNSAPVTSVTVSAVNPASGVINVGATAQYEATEHFSDGTSLPITNSALWSSASAAVATYVGGSGSNPPGTFQGISPGGPINVKACSPSDSTICGTAPITVTPPSVVCAGPPHPAAGSPATFDALGGNPSSYDWTASNGASQNGASPSFTTTFAAAGPATVTVTSGGSPSTCLVNVINPPPPPTCSYFRSNPAQIVVPAHSQLEWSCTNVSTCSITAGSNPVGGPFPTMTGSESSTLLVTPASTTQYTLTCLGIGGSAQATSSLATVTVKGTDIQETNPGH